MEQHQTAAAELREARREGKAIKRAANQEAHRLAQEARERDRLQAKEAFLRIVGDYLAAGLTPEQIAPLVKRCICQVETAIRQIKRQQRKARKAGTPA